MTPPRIISVDCDLHRIHAWDSRTGMICTSAPSLTPLATHLCDMRILGNEPNPTVIFEIASPVSAARGDVSGNAKSYNVMKWAIWNVAQAVQLDRYMINRLFVAPSNKWTRGYGHEVRHKLAQATAKNHDLRECQAMQYFYQLYPAAWVPVHEYLEAL